MELKFSPETVREWNKSLGKSREFASYQDIYDFLTICTRSHPDTSDAADTKARAKSRPSVNSVSVSTCVDCAGSHNLAACEDFRSKPVAQRNALVKKKQVCFNCLRSNHYAHQNARADRDVFIVVASIIRCYISKSRPYRRPSIKSPRREF